MNLLTDNSPDFIEVRGEKIKLNPSFKKWVKYIIATESGNIQLIEQSLFDIFGDAQIKKDLFYEFLQKTFEWAFPDSEKNYKRNSKKAYDFEEDGNTIYAELWQYFPELMKKDLSWHEGIELIRLLIGNKDTELHHRAFARIGDFTKLSKEEKKYWNEERQRLILKDKRTEQQKDEDFIFAMSAFF